MFHKFTVNWLDLQQTGSDSILAYFSLSGSPWDPDPAPKWWKMIEKWITSWSSCKSEVRVPFFKKLTFSYPFLFWFWVSFQLKCNQNQIKIEVKNGWKMDEKGQLWLTLLFSQENGWEIQIITNEFPNHFQQLSIVLCQQCLLFIVYCQYLAIETCLEQMRMTYYLWLLRTH